MYEEFIIGYVISGLAVVLLAVVIVLQCIILKKMSRSGARQQGMSYNFSSKESAYTGGRGKAICRNCATQFDAAHIVCPKCGTPR